MGPCTRCSGVGHGVEHHARAAEHARPLADGPAALRLSQAIGAVSTPLRCTWDLAGFEDVNHGDGLAWGLAVACLAGRRDGLTSPVQSLFRGVAVLTVHKRTENLLEQAHRAPVADGGELRVADAVHNRKPWRTNGISSSRAMYLP